MKKILLIILSSFLFLNISWSQNRPNILILSVDDMNYNSCGVMGSEVKNITPNIDKLADQGILFTHGYVSIPVCVPCRTSVMTGVYPHKVSEWDGFGNPKINERVRQPSYNIKRGTPTLVKTLKKAGYVTAILAKDSHHRPYEEFPWDIQYGHGKYEDLKHGRDADLFAKRTEEVINLSKTEGKPFFLSANVSDPHRPFPGSKSEQDRIEKDRFGGPMPDPSYTYSAEEITVPGFLPDLPNIRKEIAEYYSGVKRADDAVGAVLNKLKEMGVEDETVVFFFSDHGAPFPFAKECCNMNGTRTPIIVKWHGKVAPQQVDSTNFISILDFAPTILEIANQPKFEVMDGKSMRPLLGEENKIKRFRDAIVTVYHFTPQSKPVPQRSVTMGDYTYIFNAFAAENQYFTVGDPRSGYTYKAMKAAAENNKEIAERLHFYDYRVPEELYNNRKDPNSLNNLINSSEYNFTLKKLKKRLIRWMKENDDPMLTYYKNFINESN